LDEQQERRDGERGKRQRDEEGRFGDGHAVSGFAANRLRSARFFHSGGANKSGIGKLERDRWPDNRPQPGEPAGLKESLSSCKAAL
jgi:hypothetical protein